MLLNDSGILFCNPHCALQHLNLPLHAEAFATWSKWAVPTLGSRVLCLAEFVTQFLRHIPPDLLDRTLAPTAITPARKGKPGLEGSWFPALNRFVGHIALMVFFKTVRVQSFISWIHRLRNFVPDLPVLGSIWWQENGNIAKVLKV